MAQATFPDQTIEERKKDKPWATQCVQYGLSLLDANNDRITKLSRLYKSYNGERSQESINWLTKTYGVESRTKFISYKVGRAKQYLMEGEWLKRPLKVTVETTNIQAKSEKMAHLDLLWGAMYARKEILELKEATGLDIMNGVPIPESEDDPLWEKLSPKDKQEAIMQTITNEQIRSLGLVELFSEQFRDARIGAEVFGKVEIDHNGKVHFKRIDPRLRIAEEIDNDYYYERSVILGGAEWVPFHEVLLKYDLTKQEKEQLQELSKSPGSNSKLRVKHHNGQLLIEVVHVEWKSVRPSHYKYMPKTEKQLEYDSESKEIMNPLEPEVFEKKRAYYEKGEKEGKHRIETKYDEDLWEGTSLGRVVFTNLRRKPFQLRGYDTPQLWTSYIGARFGETDGVRISLQELIENFDLQFDVCEYQIMKELNRSKGKILGYDLSALPKDKSLVKIIQEMTDDGIITYNSQAAGNVGGRNLDLMNMLKEIDLGFSDSFQQLLVLQNQILNTLDKITGINELRESSAPASSTATNAMQGLENSRTITEPLFYQMARYVEKAMHRIVEATKVSWAFYLTEEGEQILGTDKYEYMKVTSELGYRDYGVHYQDGSKYLNLKQKMDRYLEFGMNSKQISMADVANYELAETTIEAVRVFESSQKKLEQIAQQQHQEQLASQEKMNQMGMETKIELGREDREDRQAATLEEIEAKTQGQMMIDDNKMKGKLFENQQKAENDLLTS